MASSLGDCFINESIFVYCMGKLVVLGDVFDSSQIIRDGCVVIDEDSGLIESVGRRSEVDFPESARTVKGAMVLPGLIDAHVHFFGTREYSLMSWVSVPETLAALRSVRDLRSLLYSGFTTVRDMGSKGGAHLARAVREGVIQGPHVLSCAKSLGQTGGDDDPINLPLDVAERLSYSYFCDGPWGCRRAVRLVLRDGADFVKVYCATGSTPEPKAGSGPMIRPQFTVEELRAIVDEAHRSGIKVAAHTIGPESLQNAVNAGVDSLEHGMGLTEELAAEIKKKNIYYVPTLSIFTESQEFMKYVRNPELGDPVYVRQHFTKDMEIAKNHSLKIVCGSDFGGTSNAEHGKNYKEILNLSRFIGNIEALRAATVNAAECIGLERAGQIKEGFQADMTVLSADPTINVENLSPAKIICVIKNGVIYP